jgi:2'-5' RNA ligase
MAYQYYRTFLALPVTVGADLLELRQTIMTDLEEERISWVEPGRFHVTLRFLGDTRLSDVRKISRALKEGGFRPEAQKVPVNGVGSFGPRKKPRVIWVGFGMESWFGALKEGVDGLLEEHGIPKQDQPFTAHLTLGRIRSLRNVSRYLKIMDGMKDQVFEPICFDSLVYYRSILGPGGPEYKQLENLWFRKE